MARRWWAGPLAGAVVVMSSCSAEVNVGRTSAADETEAAIVDALAALGIDATAECPSDIEPAEGATFDCTATAEGQQIQYEVVYDSDTHFEAENKEAVIVHDRAVQAIVDDQLVAGAEAAECGDGQITVLPVGGVLRCDVTAGGTTSSVGIWVLNNDARIVVLQAEAQSLIDGVLRDLELDPVVQCPTDLSPGTMAMECEAALADQVVHYDVEIEGEDLLAENREAILDIARVEQIVVNEEGAEAASCGEQEIVVVPPGETISCQVTVAGATRPLALLVTDNEGALEPVE